MNDLDTSMGGPTRGLGWRVAAAILSLALLGAACGSDDGDGATGTTQEGGSATTEVDASAVLGELAPASGEPVKIGWITDGKSPIRDATVDAQAADATTEYVNEYRSGIAGRPIELVTCEALAEPGKAVDCANQMVQEDVAAVVVGAFSNAEAVFDPIHAAGIPLMIYGASGAKLFTDADSTFILTNTLFGLAGLPISVAKEAGVKKISVVVIDIPVTTAFYRSLGPAAFEAEGMELNLIPVAPGTPDMTPQMQALGDDTLVHVVGNDAFCIPAFNALAAVGFDGPVSTVSQCMSTATQEQSDEGILDGMVQQATSPIGDEDDEDMQLYGAIIDKYAGDQDVDKTNAFGVAMFTTIMSLVDSTEGLTGDVTPATVLAAIKSMPQKNLISGGGVYFRCNGKAHPQFPSLCGVAGLKATLDADGNPVAYEVVGNDPLPN